MNTTLNELVDLLRTLKPKFGAVGSRDDEVQAQRAKIDDAINQIQALTNTPESSAAQGAMGDIEAIANRTAYRLYQEFGKREWLFNADTLHDFCRALLANTAQGKPERPVVAFAGMVLKAHRNDGYPGDVDGGTLQEMAIKCGLIEEIEVNEPCSDRCSCLEFGGARAFPMSCLFTTQNGKQAIDAAIALAAKKG